MNKKIILVVDDDPAIQVLINQYLSVLDVEIHPALTGEEGVEKYKELMEEGKKPDIVVMDLNLTQLREGEIDGVETTRRIMHMDSSAVVYGFTAFSDTTWSREFVEAGGKGVIGRPVGFDGFRDIMKKILAGGEVKISKY